MWVRSCDGLEVRGKMWLEMEFGQSATHRWLWSPRMGKDALPEIQERRHILGSKRTLTFRGHNGRRIGKGDLKKRHNQRTLQVRLAQYYRNPKRENFQVEGSGNPILVLGLFTAALLEQQQIRNIWKSHSESLKKKKAIHLQKKRTWHDFQNKLLKTHSSAIKFSNTFCKKKKNGGII